MPTVCISISRSHGTAAELVDELLKQGLQNAVDMTGAEARYTLVGEKIRPSATPNAEPADVTEPGE